MDDPVSVSALFVFLVGGGALIVFDLWGLVMRILGLRLVEWAMMGRWLCGFARGYRRMCQSCNHLGARGRGLPPAGGYVRWAVPHYKAAQRRAAALRRNQASGTAPAFRKGLSQRSELTLRRSPLHCQALGCSWWFRPLLYERLIGWAVHGLVAFGLVALLPLLWGVDFCRHPSLGPVLLVGFCLPTLVVQLSVMAGLRRVMSSRYRRVMFALHGTLICGNLVYSGGIYFGARWFAASGLI